MRDTWHLDTSTTSNRPSTHSAMSAARVTRTSDSKKSQSAPEAEPDTDPDALAESPDSDEDWTPSSPPPAVRGVPFVPRAPSKSKSRKRSWNNRKSKRKPDTPAELRKRRELRQKYREIARSQIPKQIQNPPPSSKPEAPTSASAQKLEAASSEDDEEEEEEAKKVYSTKYKSKRGPSYYTAEYRQRAYRNEVLSLQCIVNSTVEEQERTLWLKREKKRIKLLKESVEATETRYMEQKARAESRRSKLLLPQESRLSENLTFKLPTFCSICSQDFYPNVLPHAQTAHQVSCSICRASFPSELDLKDHALMHSRPLGIKANYHCPRETSGCGHVSVTKNLYGRHLRWHELNGEDLGVGSSEDSGTCTDSKTAVEDLEADAGTAAETLIFGWDCDYPGCFEIWPSKSQLLQHIQDTHGEIMQCPIPQCDKQFAWAAHLNYHLALIHPDLKAENAGEIIDCPYCYKAIEPELWEFHEMTHFIRPDEYMDKSELEPGAGTGIMKQENYKGNPDELGFLCTDCGKPFKRKRGYYAHIANQHPEKAEYQEEVRSAIRNPSLICTICGFFVSGAKDINTHMLRVHTYEHGTICYICSKPFKTLHTLLIHIRAVHKSEIPDNLPRCKPQMLDCLYCDRQIQGSIYRNKHHYFAHTEEYLASKPHVCKVCYKNFELESENEAHFTKTHAKWACTLCPVVNISKISYDQHQKAHQFPSTSGLKLGHTHGRKFQSERTNIYLVGNPRKTDGNSKVYPSRNGPNYLKGLLEYQKRKSKVVAIEASKIQRKYLCPKCPKQYNVASTFSVHLKWHAGSISSSLSLVHKNKVADEFEDFRIGTLSAEELEKYLNPKWNPEGKAGTPRKKIPLECLDCSETFSNEESLGRHRRFIHLGDFGPFEDQTADGHEKYKCEIAECNLVFNSEFNLNKHTKLGHPEAETSKFSTIPVQGSSQSRKASTSSRFSKASERDSKSLRLPKSTRNSKSSKSQSQPTSLRILRSAEPALGNSEASELNPVQPSESQEFQFECPSPLPIAEAEADSENFYDSVTFFPTTDDYEDPEPEPEQPEIKPQIFIDSQSQVSSIPITPEMKLEIYQKFRKFKKYLSKTPKNLRAQVLALPFAVVPATKIQCENQPLISKVQHSSEEKALFRKLRRSISKLPEALRTQVRNLRKIAYVRVPKVQDSPVADAVVIKSEHVLPEAEHQVFEDSKSRPKRKAATKTIKKFEPASEDSEPDSSPEIDDEFQPDLEVSGKIDPEDEVFETSEVQKTDVGSNAAPKSNKKRKHGEHPRALFDYQCDMCAHQLSSRERYIIHLRSIHSKYMSMEPFHTYHCLVDGCQVGFPKVELFLGHLLEKHGILNPEKYQCSQSPCGKYFVNSEDLEHHRKFAHEATAEVSEIPQQLNFECKYCCTSTSSTPNTSKFKTLSSFEKHLDSHLIDPNFVKEAPLYVCSICGAAFKQKSSFNGHLVKYHDGEGGLIPGIKPRLKKYENGPPETSEQRKFPSKAKSSCPICQAPVRADSMYNHILSTHTYPHGCECYICEEKFQDLQRVRKHLQIVHRQELLEQDPPALRSTRPKKTRRKLKCRYEDCQEICSDRYGEFKHCFQNHREQYLAEAPHWCNICFKNFKKLEELEPHVKTHDKLKCGTCGVQYFRLDYFQTHLRSHTGEKPHNCRYCGKSFSTIFILRDHEKRHKQAFTVKCEICGEGFYRNVYLMQHMQKAHGNSCGLSEEGQESIRKRRGRKSNPNRMNRKPKRSRRAIPDPNDNDFDSKSGEDEDVGDDEDYDAIQVPGVQSYTSQFQGSTPMAYQQLQSLGIGLFNNYRY